LKGTGTRLEGNEPGMAAEVPARTDGVTSAAAPAVPTLFTNFLRLIFFIVLGFESKSIKLVLMVWKKWVFGSRSLGWLSYHAGMFKFVKIKPVVR
jgi:hypothetical protein